MIPMWRRLPIITFVGIPLGDALVLHTSRSTWSGHGPRTGVAMVEASVWPAVAAAAVGALIVLSPRLSGLQTYHDTSALPPRRPEMLAWCRCAAALLAAQGLVALTLFLLNDWVGGFAAVKAWHLLLAVVWPQLGLALGTVGTLLTPPRLRLGGLLAGPAVMFYSVMGAAQLEPGPVANLSPINALALPNATETWHLGAARVVVPLTLITLLVSLAWWHAARRPAAGLTVVALVAGVLAPTGLTPLAQADELRCRTVEHVEVCWYAWGQVGSGTFTDSLAPVLRRTPPALRPRRVVGGIAAGNSGAAEQELWIGYPDRRNGEAIRPDPRAAQHSYVRELVHARCPDGPTSPLFTVRAARTLGVDLGEWTGPGEVTESQAASLLDGPERAFMQTLVASDDATVLRWLGSLLDDPRWCSASVAAWQERTR